MKTAIIAAIMLTASVASAEGQPCYYDQASGGYQLPPWVEGPDYLYSISPIGRATNECVDGPLFVGSQGPGTPAWPYCVGQNFGGGIGCIAWIPAIGPPISSPAQVTTYFNPNPFDVPLNCFNAEPTDTPIYYFIQISCSSDAISEWVPVDP
jgi:hypothetical protein